MRQLGHHLRSVRYAFGLAPTAFTACRETADSALEHALGGTETLCGIPRKRVTVYRHLFVTSRKTGRCPDCRAKAVRSAYSEMRPGL